MADEKTPAPGGEGGGDISVADAVKQITTLLPLLQKLAAIAGGKPPEEEVKEVEEIKPVATGDADPAAAETDEQKKAKAAAAGAVAATTDADDDGKDKKVAAAMDSMDATIRSMPATIFKAIAQRDRLVADLTPFVGVFDHSEMTRGDVVNYGIEKLGLTEKAKGLDSTAFLTAYLHAKPKPGAAHTAHAMDSRDPATGEKPAFVTNFLKGE